MSKKGPSDALVELRVVEGPQAGTEVDLANPVIIGRSSARSTFVIQDSEASRRHASLIPQGRSVNVQDLGSTNGTFVNDERIEDKRTVEVGDRLRIGTTVIEICLVPGAEPEEPAPEEPEEPAEEVEAAPEEAGVVEEPEAAGAEVAEVEEPEPEEAAEEPEVVEEAEPEEAVEEPEVVEEAEADAEEEQEPEAGEAADDSGEAVAEQDGAAPAPAPDAALAVVAMAEFAKQLHGRMNESFAEVLHAWSNRDPELMRPHVSAAHLERAREAADQLDRDYQINYIKKLALRDVAVRRPDDEDRGTEQAEVYVSFLARDWIEDLRTGDVIEGDSEELHAFTERWTFVREGRRGWVIDVVESVWTGPAEGTDPEDWLGLPPGSYSRRIRPTAWRHWDGVIWDAAPAPTG